MPSESAVQGLGSLAQQMLFVFLARARTFGLKIVQRWRMSCILPGNAFENFQASSRRVDASAS